MGLSCLAIKGKNPGANSRLLRERIRKGSESSVAVMRQTAGSLPAVCRVLGAFVPRGWGAGAVDRPRAAALPTPQKSQRAGLAKQRDGGGTPLGLHLRLFRCLATRPGGSGTGPGPSCKYWPEYHRARCQSGSKSPEMHLWVCV